METSPNYSAVPIRSSLGLQILLWLNAYVFGVWSVIYGSQYLYNLTSYWNTQGIFTALAFVVVNVCEFLRLNAGYAGNLKAKPAALSRFLVMTPLVLLPLLLFLLITAKRYILLPFLNIYMLDLLTYALFALMSLEFILAISTWKKLCAYQTQICKIKRDLLFQKQNLE